MPHANLILASKKLRACLGVRDSINSFQRQRSQRKCTIVGPELDLATCFQANFRAFVAISSRLAASMYISENATVRE